ncbi:MAG: hypothetical protein DCC52_11295 [Chloroflexi bacterium]|nr:MAG: hypothetical protein DCC52_11295 [Chloroflexota bacterium]
MKKILTWTRRATVTLGLSVLLGAVLLAAPMPFADATNIAWAQAPEAGPAITVDLSQTKGNIDANAFGVILSNKGMLIPEQTYFYRDANAKQDLKNLGVRNMYYWVDRDNWQQPYDPYTAEPASPASILYVDEFLRLSNEVGADPMISVNITHLCARANENLSYAPDNVQCEMATKEDAKAFLAHIKSLGIRDVKYIFLGVEPYAGCEYWLKGINCVTRVNEHKIQLTQQEYAKRVLAWTKALRQVDPKIKVGLHLLPNAYICETSCNGVSWDETVLKQAGSKVDFLVTHQYFQVDAAVSDEATAQHFSYYQNQTDVRVDKQGATAMPKTIRKELLRWLPSRKNMPILVGEFNASRTDGKNNAVAVDTRMSLFAGFGLVEGYLDSISPVKYKGVTYPGVTRLVLLDLYSLPVMLAHYLPLDQPTTLVKTPAWHMLAALRELQGKTWISAKVKNNPKTPAGRPALRVYAVKKNKNVWLVVLNHSADSAYTLNINLVGTKPTSATTTVIGDTAAGFLTQNTATNPEAVAPVTSAVPAGKIKNNQLTGMTFPAHSMTVIKLQGK